MTVHGTQARSERHGTLPDGRPVTLYTLQSGPLTVQLSEYGARIVRVLAPDRHGTPGDVTLGHDTLAPYLNPEQTPYFGATVGRYANRIAHGTFSLGGHTYRLATNNGPNHLHGGPGGLDHVLWHGEQDGPDRVTFRTVSPDGHEGYPGELTLTVTYTLTGGTLSFGVTATTTRATPVNVTNHAFWNLADGGAGSAMRHDLQLAASQYLPIDETSIPLGTVQDVNGTPFDFRRAAPVGEKVNLPDEQLRRGAGYDHHFVLPDAGGALRWAATLHDPVSGRTLDLHTTEPGLQVYSGNFLDGSVAGRGGTAYPHRSAVCLEPQHAPDSPHHPEWPSVILRPGETYRTRSEFRFGVRHDPQSR
ncbi:aldose epimerase family protein [Deinococcus aquiradiocola]|uniref:Aldose 1-epimerase n=1 Tax=Deinococcus aquiradiocola TaxID=393059 RepID=A0A917PBP0_9DEIO|nr:aldose epimerase family protein [Deinococcus aquiradiocola]GGJ70061.1 aldose 1-epimerase [Deinococcus aquiradiocola]